MIYGDAFEQYWQAGWRGVLPLPPREKTWPPKGFTGYSGGWPSYPDLFSWSEEYPEGNICLRLPENVVGLDVDAYSGKTGGDTLAHAESLWGTLPPTVRSTSREDNISGIRLYRVPESAHLEQGIDFPDKGYGHIEICQFSHRYVVCWPSVHPNGAVYRWLDHDGFYVEGVPNPESLPMLPERWIEALSKRADLVTEQADVQARFDAMPQGEMTPAVIERMNKAILEIANAPGSRHDNTLANVLALLRMAEQGHSGVPAALRAVQSVFVLAVTPDRGAEGARLEYERMMFGQRGHDLIASHPSVDPAVEEAELIALGGIQPEQLPLADAEVDDFWDSRHALRVIRQFAYARMCSPWAVLGVVLCRVLATIPPHVTLPPVIGGRGSLNLFVALVGPPGSGKDTCHDAAVEVFPGPADPNSEIYVTSAGSAEGIAHQYMHRDKKDLVQDRVSVMFFIPEIDTLVGLSSRAGSTLMPTLRSAYTGSDIGFAWADASKRLPMPKHSYRLTMVLGVQPEHAAPLLADASGGFPQRCLWFPTIDRGITADPPEAPFPLDCLPSGTWSGSIATRTVRIPDSVARTIRQAHVDRSNGTGGALDGHALFTREKVSVAVAALDGRTSVTEDDWELAGTIMRRSDQTRSETEAVVNEANKAMNLLAGKAEGHKRIAAEEVVGDATLKRVGRRLVSLLRSKGPQTDGALRQLLASRDREWFEESIELQRQAGAATLGDDGLWAATFEV